MRVALALLLAFLLALAAACGSPDPPVKEFPFTPFAYRPSPAPIDECPSCGRYLATDEHGYDYFADQIMVMLESNAVPDFELWADGYGFELAHRFGNRRLQTETLIYNIPPGSVWDVIEVAATRDGVMFAEPNGLFKLIE